MDNPDASPFSSDPGREALAGNRAQQERQAVRGATPQKPRLAFEHGASVGMDDVPRPPLQAYEDDVAQDTSDAAKASTIRPGPPFELVRASDMTFADPEYAVAGLIEVETLGVLFGKPGSRKSFAAMDLACCVATGTPFHGRDVLQGAVIFIAGEGQNGLKRRQMAWEKLNGVPLANAPLYFSKRAASLTDGDAAEEVIRAIDRAAEMEGVAPRMVLVDTVARNFGGGDENSTKDMNAFVVSVDSIKQKYRGCCVLLVHHTGHGDAERARGSSVLIGALDAEYRVTLEDDTTTLTCTKMKEGSNPPPIAFRSVVVEIARTPKGEAVTSLAFEEIDAPPKRAPQLKGQSRIAMDAFGDALLAYGQLRHGTDFPPNRQCVSLDHWRASCDRHSLSDGDSESAARMAFARAWKALQERGIVRVIDGFAWRCSDD